LHHSQSTLPINELLEIAVRIPGIRKKFATLHERRIDGDMMRARCAFWPKVFFGWDSQWTFDKDWIK
jgi:hypothetical protein